MSVTTLVLCRRGGMLVSSAPSFNSSALHCLLAAFRVSFAGEGQGGDGAVIANGCGIGGGGGVAGGCGSGMIGGVAIGALAVVAAEPLWRQWWCLLLDVTAAVVDDGKRQNIMIS